jgi:hypothetical protein
MKFFKFTIPEYRTDSEESHSNPIELGPMTQLPGIDCPDCGPWASSARILTAIPLDETFNLLNGTSFVNIYTWRAKQSEWAKILKLPESELAPGASIGQPQGIAKAELVGNVLHAFPGVVWVSLEVKEFFELQGFQGLSFFEVHMTPSQEMKYFELGISGVAHRLGSSEKSLVACENCGRKIFPTPRTLNVDEASWDGSDFFHVDWNPNLIIVTERVQKVVIQRGFTNLRFEAI